MAYIQPKNTTIELYKAVPLNMDYRDTVHYSSPTAQYNDFQQYLYKKYEKQSYQRNGLGTVRLEAEYDDVYDVNYMIFYNPKLQKKIYCFVTGCSYISGGVTDIYYEIDVLQTYMFDYSFKYSFVEREHVRDDIQGSNTQPEGLELGSEYVNNGATQSETITSWTYYILATSTPTGASITAVGERNGIPIGLGVISTTDISTFKSYLAQYIQNGYEDNIVTVYMAGANASKSNTITYAHTKLNSYTPRNKKLLTYPYCFVQVGNNLGNYVELHYERMGTLDTSGNRQLNYKVTIQDYPQPIMVFEPEINYISPNRAFQLTYSVFPTVAFAGDSFKVWWAQNKNTYIATLNSIQSNYDTNVSISNSNYQQAVNSALTSKQQTLNSISSSLTNATANRNVAKRQAQNNYNTATSNIGSAVSSGVSNGVNGLVDWLRSTGGGNDASGNLTKRANNTAVSSATTLLTNSLNASNVQAQNTLNNANLSADLSYTVAQNTASTNTVNAELAYTNALKNATLSQASANLSALTTAQNSTRELVAKKQDAMHQPNTAHGQSSCDGFNVSAGRVGFYFEEKCIAPEYARRIDQYFDLYGYAVNTLKQPSVDNRKYYTYLKTSACSIRPIKMDAQTRQTIEGIYNNGITTWKSLSQIGDYSTYSPINTPNGSQY